MTGKRKILWLLPTALLFLSGCSMAPDYTRPGAPIPADWPGMTGTTGTTAGKELKGSGPAAEMTPLPWRDYFAREELQKVILLALENNRDLKMAALNIERLRSLYRVRRAELYPHLDATASGSRQRIPESLSATGQAETVEQYGIALGVSSFELDLFGRVQNLKEKALAEYLATEQAHRTVQISLVAQVAVAYLNLAAHNERLHLARETLAAQQESYGLMQRRFDLGVSSELDLRQTQRRLDAARVDVLRYTTLTAQDENALTLIVGATVPAALLPGALSERALALQDIMPGLPSSVLLGRPDVVAAEQELKGFNANIGAARAAFFPRITLAGSVGVGSDELSSLFDSGSGAWLFAPRIVLPIFDAGTRSARLKAAEAERDMALARYEKTIQTAFKEVADALARRETIDEEVAALQSLADAAETSYRLSLARYEKGIDSYLNVIDSHRSFYGARQELIGARLTRMINRVTLYKVLGGGGV